MKNKDQQKRFKNLGNKRMIRFSNYTEIHNNAGSPVLSISGPT